MEGVDRERDHADGYTGFTFSFTSFCTTWKGALISIFPDTKSTGLSS